MHARVFTATNRSHQRRVGAAVDRDGIKDPVPHGNAEELRRVFVVRVMLVVGQTRRAVKSRHINTLDSNRTRKQSIHRSTQQWAQNVLFHYGISHVVFEYEIRFVAHQRSKANYLILENNA